MLTKERCWRATTRLPLQERGLNQGKVHKKGKGIINEWKDVQKKDTNKRPSEIRNNGFIISELICTP